MADIFVDLDDTLCFPIHSHQDSVLKYGNATANYPMIKKINDLYDSGNNITIWTARRMKTHNGNVSKIILDVGDLTTAWLKRYNVKYHNIIFGKPYYDVIIDDKAIGHRTMANFIYY